MYIRLVICLAYDLTLQQQDTTMITASLYIVICSGIPNFEVTPVCTITSSSLPPSDFKIPFPTKPSTKLSHHKMSTSTVNSQWDDLIAGRAVLICQG